MPGLTAALTRGGGNDATRRLRAISAVFSTVKPLSLFWPFERYSASGLATPEEELVAVVGAALAVNRFAPSRALDRTDRTLFRRTPSPIRAILTVTRRT